MFQDNSQALVSRLRTDLLEARKAQDQLISTTLQAVISAIDNAGAVPVPKDIDTIGMVQLKRPAKSYQHRTYKK